MTKINKRNYRPGVRRFKAYKTALKVSLSYLRLSLMSKIFGQSYYNRRVEKLHLKNALRVKNTILELQGLFIKIGQLISVLSNILPEKFREPLESLQDKVPPRDYAEVAAAIERELGRPPQMLFRDFQKEPLAAASVGQVHLAYVGDKKVAVKVQHADIPVTAKADLSILLNLVKIHAFFMDVKGLDHLYEQVRQMIAEELDYRREAEAMQIIADNLAAQEELNVVIPKVLEAFSTERVIVTEYYQGVKISQIQQIDAWQIDRDDLARRILELYCKMVLIDGYYQADPHPGNILVNENGQICLLDYGAVARLTDATKDTIPELLEAVLKDDSEKIIIALRKMGFLAEGRDADKVIEQHLALFREFLLQEVDFDGINFKDVKLKSGVVAFARLLKQMDIREISDSVQIPKDYVLLYRAVVLLMGVSFNLAPKLNPTDVIQPYIENNLMSRKESIKALVINTLQSQLTTALALPQDLHRFLKETSRGETEVRNPDVKRGFGLLWWLGQMLFFGTFALLTAAARWFFDLNLSTEKARILTVIFGICTFFFLRAWYRGGKEKNKQN